MWFPGRWLTGAVLVALAIGGLFLADSEIHSWRYPFGLAVFVLCVLATFAIISTTWARLPMHKLRFTPFPTDDTACWIVGGVIGAIGVFGLFWAKNAVTGSFGYIDGLALFVAAIFYDFMLLKASFDRVHACGRQ